MSAMPDSNMTPEQVQRWNLGALDARVRNVENELQGIHTVLNNIMTELRTRSSTQWGIIFGGISVLLTIVGMAGWMAKQPIDAAIVDNRLMVNNLANNTAPRQELDIRFGVVNRDLDRLITSVSKMADGQVLRGEHEGKWREISNSFARLQAEIAEERKNSTSTYTVRDGLNALTARITKIEEKLIVNGSAR